MVLDSAANAEQSTLMALRHPLSPPRRRVTATCVVAAVLVLAAAIAFTVRGRTARAALVHGDPDTVLSDPALAKTALPMGRDVFVAHCASCHGVGGVGRSGVADLTRSERLYGAGRVSEIEQIVRYGIRSGKGRGWNLADMPAFGSARPYARYAVTPLSPQDVADATEYILALSGRSRDPASARRGQAIYAGRGQCYDCHQADARGDSAIGAPNLADDYWIYGGAPRDIQRSIEVGRAGYSPAFKEILSAAQQRAVAVYATTLIRNPQSAAR